MYRTLGVRQWTSFIYDLTLHSYQKSWKAGKPKHCNCCDICCFSRYKHCTHAIDQYLQLAKHFTFFSISTSLQCYWTHKDSKSPFCVFFLSEFMHDEGVFACFTPFGWKSVCSLSFFALFISAIMWWVHILYFFSLFLSVLLYVPIRHAINHLTFLTLLVTCTFRLILQLITFAVFDIFRTYKTN